MTRRPLEQIDNDLKWVVYLHAARVITDEEFVRYGTDLRKEIGLTVPMRLWDEPKRLLDDPTPPVPPSDQTEKGSEPTGG